MALILACETCGEACEGLMLVFLADHEGHDLALLREDAHGDLYVEKRVERKADRLTPTGSEG